MLTVDPRELPRSDVTGLINGLVAPRPIAWLSTLDADGLPNLAPFSFFNAFCTAPPTLAIGPGSRQGINKDSLRNVRATGEFVVNVVSEALAEQANATSAEFGPTVDEWREAGLTPLESHDVAPARVAESPASFECRVVQIVDLGDDRAPTNSIVIGAITRIHVADEAVDGHRPDPSVLRLVGRMGGDLWCTACGIFELPRPRDAEPRARP